MISSPLGTAAVGRRFGAGFVPRRGGDFSETRAKLRPHCEQRPVASSGTPQALHKGMGKSADSSMSPLRLSNSPTK